MFALKSRRKSRRNIKMAEWLSVPRVIFRTSSKVKRSKVKVTRPLNSVTKISHTFGTENPRSSKLVNGCSTMMMIIIIIIIIIAGMI